MRKLGLDLGTKTCGFAISDELGIIATGLENFHYEQELMNQVIDRINYWLNKYNNQISTLVLGYPTNVYDGSKNARTLYIESFYELLKSNFADLKIVYVDERFSTKIATQRLKECNLKAAKIKKIKDKMSAVVILETHLKQI